MTYFYATINGDFERFLFFNFETCFLKNGNFLWKTGVPFFSWKYYHWKPHKTDLPKAIVKTNIMESTKGPITKIPDLPLTTYFFWKFSFSVKTSYKYSIKCINFPNVHIVFPLIGLWTGNFGTVRCGAYWRPEVIRGRRLFQS